MRVMFKYVVPPAVFAVGVILLSSVLAYGALDAPGRASFYNDVLRLSYQFLVLVLLGLLVTTSLEAGRARLARLHARQERKEQFVRDLIDLTHDVDLARILVQANRSVTTWDEQMNERIIPAYIKVRDLSHDAKTAAHAGDRIFSTAAPELDRGGAMNSYLHSVITEFAQHKQELAELQREAAQDRGLQDRLWEEMLTLKMLRDLVEGGEEFGGFRSAYVDLLQRLRRELAPGAAVWP